MSETTEVLSGIAYGDIPLPTGEEDQYLYPEATRRLRKAALEMYNLMCPPLPMTEEERCRADEDVLARHFGPSSLGKV